MTETEAIEAVQSEMAGGDRSSARALDLVERGLRDNPTSVRLWCLRGDLIQLADDGPPLLEALASYREALRYDPNSVEATNEISRFLDLHGEQESAG